MRTYTKLFLFLMIALGATCFASTENHYLQPNEVYVTPNGLYFLFEKELVQVAMLCADENGIYVPASEMSRKFVRCPHCGRWYDPEKGHDNCRGPE